MAVMTIEEKVTVHVDCTREEMAAVAQAVMQLLTHEKLPALPPPQTERIYVIQREPRARIGRY